MPEFSTQSEGVDVERIMQQIRDRIRADGGADDTAADAALREQADARAAQVVDPDGARAALGARPTPAQPAAAPPPTESFDFDHDTIYRSSRGGLGPLLHGVRKLLAPLVKFFFNVEPVTHALAVQSRINAQQAAFDDRVARLFDAASARLESREEIDKLSHRVMLDLVAEMTRLSVEMKNHRMLVESVAARLDFFERQARTAAAAEGAGAQAAEQPGTGDEPARRRRRRGRRRSGRAATGEAAAGEATAAAEAAPAGDTAGGDEATPNAATETADSPAAPEAVPVDAPPSTPQPAAVTETAAPPAPPQPAGEPAPAAPAPAEPEATPPAEPPDR